MPDDEELEDCNNILGDDGPVGDADIDMIVLFPNGKKDAQIEAEYRELFS